MNDPDDPLSDESLESLLAPLRDMSVPEGLSLANRHAMKYALSRRSQGPWWQRTVAVPIPLAVAATIAMAVATAAALRPPAGPKTVAQESSATPTRASEALDTPDNFLAVTGSRPTWNVTHHYIQSLGAVSVP